MELLNSDVREVLTSKGVHTLHHANTVLTSCHFLRQQALLSRGNCSRLGLQTGQSSDQSDKKFSIWHDVFTDSVDIHNRANKLIVYGPVLFIFSMDLLNEFNGNVWVTKSNPWYWRENTAHENKWFTSIDDLNTNFIKGNFSQMVIFRHCGGLLEWKDHLLEILLDDPALQTTDGNYYYDMAVGALLNAMSESRKIVPIRQRACPVYCECKTQYYAQPNATKRKFFLWLV